MIIAGNIFFVLVMVLDIIKSSSHPNYLNQLLVWKNFVPHLKVSHLEIVLFPGYLGYAGSSACWV